MFCGGKVESIIINNKNIDILIIDDYEHTPIYLKNEYKGLHPGLIYARIQDRNTGNNQNAPIDVIEKLWKKRFGLTKSTYQFILEHLKNWEEWGEYNEDYYYIYRPEYKIHKHAEHDGSTMRSEFYAYTQINSNVYYGNIDIIANNTVLDTFQTVYLDGGRLHIPVPKWGYIEKDALKREDYRYKYYEFNSPERKILDFMYDNEDLEQRSIFEKFKEVVLFFKPQESHQEFEKFVNAHLDTFKKYIIEDDTFYNLSHANKEEKKIIQNELKVGVALNKMLKKYRKYVSDNL